MKLLHFLCCVAIIRLQPTSLFFLKHQHRVPTQYGNYYNFPDLEKYGKCKLLYGKIFMFLSLFFFLKKEKKEK